MSQTMLNVYDLETKRKTAVLQNAFNIIETHELNQIYSLTFTLPAEDQKVMFCQPRHFVRWGDEGELYRIKSVKQNDSDTGTIVYDCEHVVTTLCDNMLFGAYKYGGGSIKTAAVITWLLNQQKTKNWVLGSCDFERKFEYGWEQENLLNALYAIPKEFSTPYKWEFDTTVFPWKISLKALDGTKHPEYYIQAKRNLLSSGKSADFADICTRIYPLGYGEGVNQLNIKEVNNGVAYLQSPENIISQYGLIEKVLVDRRFENPESLKAYAQTMLDNLQTPAFSRSFDVTDLYPLTKQSLDIAEVGKICMLTEDGTTAYITKIVHQWDVPGNLQIELSTKATDVASRIADLAERVRIESVYAQGATQLYQHSKDANATPEKGMTLSLYFPSEMRQINKILLKLSLKPFRSYSSATESAGAVKSTSSEGGGSTYTSTDGGGSTQTSSEGGGVASSSVSQSTISANVTSGPSTTETTKSGGTGSDVVTSKTKLEGNTGYIELETNAAGGVTNHQTTKTNDVEKTTTASGGVTNHQTTKTIDVEKSTSAAGGVTNHQTTKTNDVEKTTTASGGVTNHQTTKTNDVEKSTTAAGSVTNHQTTKTYDVEKSTTAAGGVTNQQTTKTLDIEKSTSASGGVTDRSTSETEDVEQTTTTAGGITNQQTTKTIDVEKTTSASGGVTDHKTSETEDAEQSTTAAGGVTNQQTTKTIDVELTTTSAGGVTNQQTTKTNDVEKETTSSEGGSGNTGSTSISISGDTTYSKDGYGNWKSSTDGAQASIWMNDAGNHDHNIWCYTGEVTPPASANYRHNHAINYTGGALSNGSHSHGLGQYDHSHGMFHLHSLNLSNVGSHYHSYSVPAHTHKLTVNGHLHTVTIPDHAHKVTISGHLHTITIPNHTHKVTVNGHLHTLTIPDHTHKFTVNGHLHTVTIPDHSHKVTVKGHLHTITIPDHTHKYTVNGHLHTVTIPDHSHTVTVNGHLHTITIPDHTHKYTVNAHLHTITIPDHTHKVTVNGHLHTVTIPDHTHNYEINGHLHTVTIPDHTHNYMVNSHLHTVTIPDHTHTINKHRHLVTIEGHSHTINKSVFAHVHNMEHTHAIELSSVGSHSHTFTIPDHTHSLTIPEHSHKVTINSHTHTVEIPAHTHEITAGIFESGNPTAFDIYVTGIKKATVKDTGYDGDITAWLLNSSNQVPRDSWIDVEIRPNDLAYVVSSVFVQGFVQSRGGGNY